MIDHVYLFWAEMLVEKIKRRGVKLYEATSVAQSYWEEAEIYPKQTNPLLPLSDETKRLLALFGTGDKP